MQKLHGYGYGWDFSSPASLGLSDTWVNGSNGSLFLGWVMGHDPSPCSGTFVPGIFVPNRD